MGDGLPAHNAGARGGTVTMACHRQWGGRLGGAVLTPRVLAAHGRPTGQGFTVGGLPTRRGGVDVVEVGRLDGARRRRRWLVAGGGSGELLQHR
jgi:hypothetical protein